MSSTDTQEASAKYTEAALSLMRQHSIPTTPANYAIWYEHVAGRNPGLDRALAPVLAGAAPFTPKLAEEIHSRVLGNSDGDGLRAMGQRFQTILAEALARIGEVGQDNVRFAEELTAITGDLAQVNGGEEVAAVVRSILSATEKVIQRNKRLETELTASTREIGTLRQNLEDTRRAALTDPLTQLANRKHFERRLDFDAKAARGSGEPLSLLLLDIDHFKRFNDTYGHPIGDEVLKVVARTLKEGLKGRDTAARYGGEEFAVILPQTDMHQAAKLGDQIRQALATKSLKNRRTGQNFGTVTMSIGVACYRAEEPLPDLIERADKALYAAKHQGRNRVLTESDLPSDVAA
jgi:diguanylate cyclase